MRSYLPRVIKRGLRSLCPRRVARWGPTSSIEIGECGSYNVAYRKGTADEAVIAHSFNRDIFFSGVPEYQPAKDHIIIDVGAHIGTFTLLAASKVPRGRVYAIEACKESFNLLRINIALNRMENIDAERLALCDERSERVLYYSGDGNWGHTIVSEWSGRGEPVPGDSLAGFMSRRGIVRCNFVKMNCEGAEFPIILGAPLEILQRFDLMLVLYHCDLCKARNEEDLIAHLEDAGFSTEIRNRSEKRGWIVATNALTGSIRHSSRVP